MTKINTFLLLVFIVVSSCELKPVSYKNGVSNLLKKQENLKINFSNKNDVIKVLGPTILVSFPEKDEWAYMELEKTKSIFAKEKIVKNDVIILKFNNKGLLIDKKIFDKSKINSINFDDSETISLSIPSSFNKKIFTSLKKRMSKDINTIDK
jgi:outer membrane protein assembly factor BamE (lipoprotein component of BamABCDE complex)